MRLPCVLQAADMLDQDTEHEPPSGGLRNQLSQTSTGSSSPSSEQTITEEATQEITPRTHQQEVADENASCLGFPVDQSLTELSDFHWSSLEVHPAVGSFCVDGHQWL